MADTPTLREAAIKALEAMENFTRGDVCEASHHSKADRHGPLSDCPVAARFVATVEGLRAALAPSTTYFVPDSDGSGRLVTRQQTHHLIKPRVPPTPTPSAAQAEGAKVPNGWNFNHAQELRPGIWEVGYRDEEDDRFSPVITVDTGLYYQAPDAEPLARVVLAALTAAQGERAGLTADQCAQLVRSAVSGITGVSSPERWFLRGIRAAERAHGIGTTEGGA